MMATHSNLYNHQVYLEKRIYSFLLAASFVFDSILKTQRANGKCNMKDEEEKKRICANQFQHEEPQTNWLPSKL